MTEEDSRPESSGVWSTLGLGVAVILAASVCFLAAFFITADLLDDSGAAGTPSQVPARSDVAPAEDEAGDAASDRAAPISPGALAGAPEPSPGAPAAATGAGELFTTTAMPDFDPDTLIHGGPGEQGAILAGPGIVRSSGADRRTDWELIVPSAQIRAPVAKVGVTPRNLLGAPDNPEIIGWWEDGPAPGEDGNVLMDGHRDYRDIFENVGFGVCWLLTETRPGDLIIVRDISDGRAYVYTVSEIHSVDWDDPSGDRFLRSSDDPILTLVTCEGAFDEENHNYSQRRVVVAELTDRVAPSSGGG